LPVSEPRLEKVKLDPVEVLELIDEEVTENPVLSVAKCFVSSKLVGAFNENVIEVKKSALSLI
jgi:hypothetical protein